MPSPTAIVIYIAVGLAIVAVLFLLVSYLSKKEVPVVKELNASDSQQITDYITNTSNESLSAAVSEFYVKTTGDARYPTFVYEKHASDHYVKARIVKGQVTKRRSFAFAVENGVVVPSSMTPSEKI